MWYELQGVICYLSHRWIADGNIPGYQGVMHSIIHFGHQDVLAFSHSTVIYDEIQIIQGEQNRTGIQEASLSALVSGRFVSRTNSTSISC